MFLSGIYGAASAQNTKTTQKTSKSKKSSAKANKVADEKSGDNQKINSAPARMNKNGTPDMRYKVNKNKTAPQTSAPAVLPPQVQSQGAAAQKAPVNNAGTISQTPAPSGSSTNNTGKIIGPDSKGRTIYEGPRGGHYYINAKGHKEYVKKGQ
ncbi:MAG: hypothetical protein NVS9B7_25790 [Flavisolibacter sp.]